MYDIIAPLLMSEESGTISAPEYATEPPRSRIGETLDFIVELVKIVAICASFLIVVRWFLFQPFIVKGSSMEPNFYNDEYLIIYELSYHFPKVFKVFSEDNRGRVLIVHPPTDPKEFYIKRLIGLPGERVRIYDGRVTIYNDTHPDGLMLDESYLPYGLQTFPGNSEEVTLGLDEIYVLGDNRGASLDSRRIGPIPVKNVIGEPVIRGWPLQRIGFISR